LQQTHNKNIHIHGASCECRENGSSATLVAFNKGTCNARENEEEIADIELATSDTGIEKAKHLRRKLPQKHEENHGTMKIKVKKTPE